MRMIRRKFPVGAWLLTGVVLTLSAAGCGFEEVHCELSFATDAMPGVTNTWVTQECTAKMWGDNLTVLDIEHEGQSMEISIVGPLGVGQRNSTIEYRDGSRRWTHDGGSNGVGPACVVLLDSAQAEPWTVTERVRASGTISCPGKLTAFSFDSVEDDELALLDVSFDVFASDGSGWNL